MDYINVINIAQYHSRVKEAIKDDLKNHPSGCFKSLVPMCDSYEVLANILKKSPLNDPERFVEYSNSLFKANKYSNYGPMQWWPMDTLKIDKANAKNVIFNITDNGRGRYPLVWGLDNFFNEYAFFKTEGSKEDIEGIYLASFTIDGGKPNRHVSLINFMMLHECHDRLIEPITRYKQH